MFAKVPHLEYPVYKGFEVFRLHSMYNITTIILFSVGGQQSAQPVATDQVQDRMQL